MAFGSNHSGNRRKLPIGMAPDESVPLKYIRDLPSLGHVVCVYWEDDRHPLVQQAEKLLRQVSTILKSGVLQTQGLWDGHGMSLLEYELWAHVGPLARVHCQNLKIPVDARCPC